MVSTRTAAPYIYSWETIKYANGAHTLSAKAYDAAGNVGESAIVAVTIFNDTTAPTVAITAPIANTTTGSTTMVTASASDDVAVSKVVFFVNGALQATSTNAPYGFSWNTSAVAKGAYTLSAKAYDAAGNVGEAASVAVNVFNDTTAPTVAITAPAINTTADGSATVTAIASDDVAVNKVQFFVNGILQANSTSAPYGFTWNTASIPNGPYTLSAKAYDAAGNVGHSAGVTVNVFNDSTAPTVAITSPITNSTAGQSVTVSITSNDDVAVERVELYLDGTLEGSITNAPYNYTLNTWSMPNGAHTLTARAYDGAGNQGESSRVVLNVYNDNLPPTVSNFSMPAIANTLTVPVAIFQATDNTGIAGYLITESATAPSASAIGWSATAPTSFTFADSGSRTAYAWAKDAAGHVSASASATLMIDTVLPVITSLALLNDTGTVTVNAAAQDNVAVGKMQLFIDDMLQEETQSSSLSYALPVPVKRSQTLSVKVYDVAGNLRSQTFKVSKN